MFKNIVKNTVAALVLAAPFVSFAAAPATSSKFSHFHKAGFALQLGGGIDYSYYTKDHTYTMGVYGLEYTGNKNGAGTNSHTLDPGFYVRKNFKINDQTQYMLGVSINTYKYSTNSSGVDFDDSAWAIKAPYTGLEYFVSPNVGFSCSIRPFHYINQKLETAGSPNVETFKYMTAGSFQLNYIFG
ncbi:MAG: hypothetical protein CMF52_08980 [Legionellales bacterium]|nr:hypothetical protein [Legionellales bacterium]HAV93986.1 hypothetical protein [Pseudomonadota bacterium]|tara:strand:+ start:164 stop:718 length:555 start_codon:yes stop_codon:yes gene_type:complete